MAKVVIPRWIADAFPSMSFIEKREQSFISSGSQEGTSETVRSRGLSEEPEKRRQEALHHLIESGRVATKDDAEKYLATIVAIKEKLLSLVREQLSNKNIEHENAMDIGNTGYGKIIYKDRGAHSTDIKEFTIHNIDQTNPSIWNLTYKQDTSLGTLMGQSLRVHLMDAKGDIDIYPDIMFDAKSYLVKRLEEHFTQEDLEFIKREFMFSQRDFAKILKEIGERLERDSAGVHASPGWRALWQETTEKE